MTGGGGNTVTACGGCGTIFKIKPDGTGYLKVYDFTGASTGSNPNGSLISDGIFLYGITSAGGSDGTGVIFKIKPDGSGYNKLYDFNSNGNAPPSSLVFVGSYIYGMTTLGGANQMGVIFKCDTTTTTGINQLSVNNGQVIVYPNPAKDEINLKINQFNNLAKYTIEITNIIGESVYRQIVQSSTCQIDVSDLNTGIYFLSIENEEKKMTQKITILH
jgi:uncharacterized repeat protein (TIGR03803 family)